MQCTQAAAKDLCFGKRVGHGSSGVEVNEVMMYGQYHRCWKCPASRW